jgi:hypothetical protein
MSCSSESAVRGDCATEHHQRRSLRTFLTSTHRDISHPEGMPNPQLLDFQIKQVSAYLLSLRKQP